MELKEADSPTESQEIEDFEATSSEPSLSEEKFGKPKEPYSRVSTSPRGEGPPELYTSLVKSHQLCSWWPADSGNVYMGCVDRGSIRCPACMNIGSSKGKCSPICLCLSGSGFGW